MTAGRGTWSRPRRYDRNLVVIGAGSAGLVSAYLGAVLRAGVTLVEGDRMGGDCLNTGCVPSKAIIRSARLAAESRRAASLGLSGPPLAVDFAAVMERVQAKIAAVASHDSVARFSAFGVDVRRGRARIVSPWCVEVDGSPITTRAIVIAAGAEPIIPDLPGLAETEYLTSETLWRLRSQVTLVQQAPRLLMREDDEVSALATERMAADGVRVLTGTKAIAIETTGGVHALRIAQDDVDSTVTFDAILVAIGRRARTSGYGLEELGIGITPKQTVATNAFLQTSHPSIVACGDVAGPYQFTHAAAHQAQSAVLTGLFAPFYRSRPDYTVMPAVTFTDPEVAWRPWC